MRTGLWWVSVACSTVLTLNANAWTERTSSNVAALTENEIEQLRGMTTLSLEIQESYVGVQATNIVRLPFREFATALLAGVGLTVKSSTNDCNGVMTINVKGKERGSTYAGINRVPAYLPTGGELDVEVVLRRVGLATAYRVSFHSEQEVPERTHGSAPLWQAFTWSLHFKNGAPDIGDYGVYRHIGRMIQCVYGEEKAIAAWNRVLRDCRPTRVKSTGTFVPREDDNNFLSSIRRFAVDALASIGTSSALETAIRATEDDPTPGMHEATVSLIDGMKKASNTASHGTALPRRP